MSIAVIPRAACTWVPHGMSPVRFNSTACFSLKVLVAQSCPTLCDPTDWSPPGSSDYGIFQAKIPEWVATSFSRGFSRHTDQTHISCIVGRFFIFWASKEVSLWIPLKSLSLHGLLCFFSLFLTHHCPSQLWLTCFNSQTVVVVVQSLIHVWLLKTHGL